MALIAPRLGRPLAAVWISLGLHGALLAWVQVAPPHAAGADVRVIEARLVQAHDAPPAVSPPAVDVATAAPDAAPAQLQPARAAQAVPVAPSPVPAAARPALPSPPAAVEAAPEPATVAEEPALAISSAVDLNYYRVRELDVQPRALRDIVPDYPAEADRAHQSGKVRLRLKLEADGRVGGIEILGAEPPGVFEESALSALRAARFAPAQKAGRSVRALLEITVVYDWEGRQRGLGSGER